MVFLNHEQIPEESKLHLSMRVLGMGEEEQGEGGKCGLEGKDSYEIGQIISVEVKIKPLS